MKTHIFSYIFYFLLFIILPNSVINQETEENQDIERSEQYFVYETNFEKGDTLFAFKNIDLKLYPNNKSKNIAKIKIGDVLLIDTTILLDNSIFEKKYKNKYIKVKHHNQTGYIKISDIAICNKNIDNDFKLLVNLIQIDDYITVLNLIVYKDTEILSKLKHTLYGNMFEINVKNNKGLTGIKNIIEIDLLSEACGMNGGIDYITWDGLKLKELFSLTSSSDSGIFNFDESVIFPSDSLGEENKILHKVEYGEADEDSYDVYMTIIYNRKYKWDGKKLIPKFKKPKF